MNDQYLYEFIAHEKVMPIRCFIVGIDQFDFHWHKDVEIFFLLKGSIRVIEEGKEYLLKKGDVILFNSHILHSFNSTIEENVVLILQFDPEIYETIYESNKTFLFQCNSADPELMQETGFRLLQSSLAEICLEIYRRKDGYQFYIKSSVFRLIGELFRYFPYTLIDRQEQDRRNGDLDRLKKIVDYMYSNFSEEISLRSVAKAQNMSVSYLCHFLKQMSGVTFLQFLTLIRIEKAKKLLKETNFTILRITEECGFGNTTSFYRIFSKRTGMSPGEYRAKGIETSKRQMVQGYTIVNPDFGFELLREYLDKK